MLIILKVSLISVESAFLSISGLMAQSVVINTSIVAILGCIIPEPLAIPPILQVFPPISKLTAISLTLVSVVIMPSAAFSLPTADNDFTRLGIPFLMGVISSG